MENITMATLAKYFVTGWSPRFNEWMTEVFDAKDIEAAKLRYWLKHNSHKKIKAYRLRVSI